MPRLSKARPAWAVHMLTTQRAGKALGVGRTTLWEWRSKFSDFPAPRVDESGNNWWDPEALRAFAGAHGMEYKEQGTGEKGAQ